MSVPLHWMPGDPCMCGGERGTVLRVIKHVDVAPMAIVDLESGPRCVVLAHLELVPLPCDTEGADATWPLDGSGDFA